MEENKRKEREWSEMRREGRGEGSEGKGERDEIGRTTHGNVQSK